MRAFALSALSLLVLCTFPAAGQERCKPPRIRGLSDADVNTIVLREIANVSNTSADRIDLDLPLKAADRTSNGAITYAFFFHNISEDLEIELAKASPEVVSQLGKSNVGAVYEHTPVRTLQALVRSAYKAAQECQK